MSVLSMGQMRVDKWKKAKHENHFFYMVDTQWTDRQMFERSSDETTAVSMWKIGMEWVKYNKGLSGRTSEKNEHLLVAVFPEIDHRPRKRINGNTAEE